MQNWLKLNGYKVVLVIMAIALSYTLSLFFRARHLGQQNAQQVIESNNRIAELSHVIEENEHTWSRLTQERDDQMAQLQAQNQDLAAIVQSRNEQIASLTTIVANFRPVRVIVDSSRGDHITETTTDGRVRVEFEQTHSDYMTVSGYTLSSPSYAEIGINFTRPIGITVVSTQTEDGAWETYVSTDIEDIEVGNIEASVNPRVAAASISQRQEQHGWEDGFSVGILGGVGTSGHSGGLGIMAGYDFGPVTIGIHGTGVVSPSGGELLLGLYTEINPFDL